MNKKQWIALGLMFFVFALLASYVSAAWFIVATTGDIVANIQDAMYTFLTWLCFIAAVACWICGWLEKEGGIMSEKQQSGCQEFILGWYFYHEPEQSLTEDLNI